MENTISRVEARALRLNDTLSSLSEGNFLGNTLGLLSLEMSDSTISDKGEKENNVKVSQQKRYLGNGLASGLGLLDPSSPLAEGGTATQFADAGGNFWVPSLTNRHS